jgi:16S rRNA (uracil1498-N3)-methyltransferase
VSTPPLFFVEHLPAGDRLRLDGPEGRHAARVKRLTVGERLRVADGLGAVADCAVIQVLADGLELEVIAWGSVEPPQPYLVVVQALAKGDRAELAVELSTELGADEIVPWAASRSIVQWQDQRVSKGLDRWRRTARESAKQSRRPRVPIVSDLASTADVVARIGTGRGLVLHEGAGQPLAGASLPASGEIVVVVGPEGGVSDDELGAFAGAGASLVRLGEPVLRTSTAGAAALAVLSVRVGRWSGGG